LEQKTFENSITPPSDVKSKIMAAIKDELNFTPVISFPADASNNSDVPAKAFR